MKKYLNIKIKYIFFISLLHLVLVLMSVPLLYENKLYFLGVELFIVISIMMSIYIYRSLIRPINLISEGIEAIKSSDFNTKFRKVGQWEMDNLIDVYNEMIETLRLRQLNMEKQNLFLEKLVMASPTGIIILDLDEKIELLNPKAKKVIDLDSNDIYQKKIVELNGPLFRQIRDLTAGKSKIVKLDGIKSYRCQKSHFINRGFPRHFIIIEELTDEIINTEKKAYGKIIRMMSHEINNTVGSINSILDSVLHYLDKLENMNKKDYRDALSIAISRNNRLNKFMANFAEVARLPQPQIRKVDLHDLIKSVQILMNSNPGKQIEWNLKFCDDDLIIRADMQQMELVLVNILKNAMEAIESVGKIEVITEKIPAKKLLIRDNGAGISESVKYKLFTPFFSTKQTGQGIGLTLVRDILTNHGFGFALFTNSSNVTTFVINFDNRL